MLLRVVVGEMVGAAGVARWAVNPGRSYTSSSSYSDPIAIRRFFRSLNSAFRRFSCRTTNGMIKNITRKAIMSIGLLGERLVYVREFQSDNGPRHWDA